MEPAFTRHYLVPHAEKLAPEEAEKLLAALKISIDNLPLIHESDPMVEALQAKPGDVLKIRRHSPVAKEAEYYRLVVE